MRLFLFSLFLVLTKFGFGQEIDTAKHDGFIQFRGIYLPYYAPPTFMGSTFSFYIEKSISEDLSLSLGYKYLNCNDGFTMNNRTNVLITELKYYPEMDEDDVRNYFGIYSKYRYYYFYEENYPRSLGNPNSFYKYRENSICLGPVIGKQRLIGDLFVVDYYIGAGYFIGFNKEQSGNFETKNDFKRIDLRVGLNLGLNFKTKW